VLDLWGRGDHERTEALVTALVTERSGEPSTA
jgi:hypothetical protein